jgi:hypothetical protein
LLDQTLRSCAQARIGAITNELPQFGATHLRVSRPVAAGRTGGSDVTRIGAFPNAPAAASSTDSPNGLRHRVIAARRAAVGQRPTIDPTSPLREMGPVDYLVVQFPGRRVVSGEGLSMLLDLVDRRVIHILDLGRQRCSAPRVREHLGSATRDALESLGRPARREWAHSDPVPGGRAPRRGRRRRSSTTEQFVKEKV